VTFYASCTKLVLGKQSKECALFNESRHRQGSHASLKMLEFFLKFPGPRKSYENYFGCGRSWKLKLKLLESPGIYFWFRLTNTHITEFGLLLTETT